MTTTPPFSIPSQELANKLEAIQFGATTNEVATQSDCVIFQDEQMYTFDGQIYCCIGQKFPCNCAVPYKMMSNAIGKPGKTIDIEIVPGESSLVMKRTSARTTSETTIPYKPEILHQIQAIPALTSEDEFHPFSHDILENIDSLESVIDKTQRGTVLYYIHFTPDFVEAANLEHVVRVTSSSGKYPATFPASALIPAGYLGKIHKLSTLESFLLKNGWMYIKTTSGVRYAFPIITDTAYVDAAVLQSSLYPTDEGVPLILPPELAEEMATGMKFSDDGVAYINVVGSTDPDETSGTLEMTMHNAVSAHACKIKCDIVPGELKNIKIAIHAPVIAKIAKGESPSVTIHENAVIGSNGNVRYAVSTLATPAT